MENNTKQDIHFDVLKNGIGNSKEEPHRQLTTVNSAIQDFDSLDGASAAALDKQSWYALNIHNNNNAFLAVDGHVERQYDVPTTLDASKWSCELCESLASVDGGNGALVSDGSGDGVGTGEKVYTMLGGAKENVASLTVPEKGGGGVGLGAGEAVDAYTLQNGIPASQPAPHICKHFVCLSNATQTQIQLSPEISAGCFTPASNYALAGAAASLTPPANSNSNRTSINNSTDNLSYSSDNYYPDELLVLQNTISADDDDIEIDNDEAEKISLCSDDCVYAYRGDGADYDLTLETIHNQSHFVDDETDFLEMDFEPDPLSEVECGSIEVGDSFLMQRDISLAPAAAANAAHAHRQLYNSPIENLPPLQKGCCLQTQSSLLSKNFSRIALHLDQIKSEETPTPDGTRRESASLAGTVLEGLIEPAEPQSHSLPNSLLTTFGRDSKEKQQEESKSPSKVTGAKPKRLNTFSTSSSTSSKISFKSRTSVRSIAFNSTGLCSSNSFDERSVSCTDFRCNPADDVVTTNAPVISTVAFNDETCLDCLEKEFLANTIGKAVDLSECPKCQKRRAFNAAAYGENLCHSQLKSTSLCYDFNDSPNSESLFQANEFLQFNQRNENRHKNSADKLNDSNAASQRQKLDLINKTDLLKGCNVANQRSSCDILYEKQLIKSVLTEKEIATISINNMNEDTLVQALDKLKLPYNVELIKSYEFFAHNTTKEFKSLKHLVLHASKQNCNYPRLKRLIEMVTRGQVEVLYKKDTQVTQTEMVQLKVADILHQWTRTNNLELLKQLDKRFHEANILGKIANIIRQAQQRCSPRRPLPEYISIPQYYASGYLKLTKKP